MKFQDAVTISGTRKRSDGSLVADARVARTGIQLYLGSEVGKPEMSLVRVMRPESEVFKSDTLASFAHRPLTNDHPSEMVTADNWRKHAVGNTGEEIARDGTFIRVPLMVSDAGAIADIEAGKRELSAGYTCDLDWTAGTHDGVAYDAVQTNIRANHIAIVGRGRAGSSVRIGDNWGPSPQHKETTMEHAIKTVTVDGLSVQTTDQGAQAITKLQTDLATSAAKIATLAADHAKELATRDAEMAKKDAEIADLKGKVLDGAALDAKVAARADLVDRARKLAPKVDAKGLSDTDLRKAVVTAVRGADVIAGKSEAYIDAAFDLLEMPANNTMRDALRTPGVSMSDANKQTAYEKRLQDAWRGEPATKQ
jgi:hypothetical protein